MTCPNPACRAQYTFPDQFAGRTVMCSKGTCRSKIQVPPIIPTATSSPTAHQNRGALTDLRCYDCGQRINENELVRRDVRTGWSSTSWSRAYSKSGSFSTGRGNTSRYSRVNLCRTCNAARDRAAFLAAMVVLGIICVALGIICIVVVAARLAQAIR